MKAANVDKRRQAERLGRVPVRSRVTHLHCQLGCLHTVHAHDDNDIGLRVERQVGKGAAAKEVGVGWESIRKALRRRNDNPTSSPKQTESPEKCKMRNLAPPRLARPMQKVKPSSSRQWHVPQAPGHQLLVQNEVGNAVHQHLDAPLPANLLLETVRAGDLLQQHQQHLQEAVVAKGCKWGG